MAFYKNNDGVCTSSSAKGFLGAKNTDVLP